MSDTKNEQDIEALAEAKPPARRNKVQRTYSDGEVDRGLFALALASGNCRRASEMLAADGDGIPAPALQTWKRHRRADLYIQIQQDVYPRIAERMAEEMEDLFATELELERKLVERVNEDLPNLKPGELSTALRNAERPRPSTSTKRPLTRSAQPHHPARLRGRHGSPRPHGPFLSMDPPTKSPSTYLITTNTRRCQHLTRRHLPTMNLMR